MMDVYDVLTVLNDLEPVDLDSLEFGVITAGSEYQVSTFGGVKHTPGKQHFWPFQRGEVLVLDKRSGREPFGEGRKPAKWGVTCETVATFAESMAIRSHVLGAGSSPVDTEPAHHLAEETTP